jgi:hypothetical protein
MQTKCKSGGDVFTRGEFAKLMIFWLLVALGSVVVAMSLASKHRDQVSGNRKRIE